MLEAIMHLALDSFMLSLHKSQFGQSAVQAIGHQWISIGFWAPNIIKLTILMQQINSKLAHLTRYLSMTC